MDRLLLLKRDARPLLSSSSFASSLTLIIGGGLSLLMFSLVSNQIVDDAQLRFERKASDVQHVITARISSYVDVIRGVKALFHTTSMVSRVQFHRYVTGLKLAESYPGFQNLNFAQFVSEENKAAFESAVRQDGSLDLRGYPDFSIKPAGQRSSYAVLLYQEPMENNASTFGKDLAFNPRVQAALATSRDTGELISSGALIQVKGADQHIGLAMRMPVYRNDMPLATLEQRRAAYIGSVGAGFNVIKLMQGVADDEALRRMRFRLYDRRPAGGEAAAQPDSKENLVFDSNQLLDASRGAADVLVSGERLVTSLPIEIGGRSWELVFSARPQSTMNRLDAALPWLALLGGLLCSILLSWAFYAMTSARSSAVRIAKAMTRHLRENQARLAEAQRTAHLGSLSLDPADQSMHWSAETYRILGMAVGEIRPDLGQFLSRICDNDLAQVKAALANAVLSGDRMSGEYRISHPHGAIRWTQIIFQASHKAADARLNGTIMDITERKQATLLAEVEHRVTQLVASGANPQQLMPEVLEALVGGLDCVCAVFRIVDVPGARLIYSDAWCADGMDLAPFIAAQREEQIPLDLGLAGRCWMRQAPILRPDFDAIAENGQRAAMPSNVSSLFACPVVSGEEIFGVIECFGRSQYKPYEGLQKMLQSISSQISLYLQRKAAEKNLHHVAWHDALTDLPNRSMFNQTLQYALNRHARYQEGLAVLFIDVDRFKVINDTLGHGAGDLLLIEFSRRLTACLRESDSVARLGGDEFAVMIERFPGVEDVIAVVNKMLGSAAQPFHINGKEFRTTASIGIAVAPDHGSDVEALLRNADVAMYRAKVNGNSYQFYSPLMNKDSLRRFTLEASLRHAVARDQMFLHYQPKLDLRTGKISGVEALLRWRHPQLGMISPVEFIPLAEESGLIIEIGKWVLKTACLQNVEWQRQGLAPIRVAVNLSARQFRDEKLLQDVSDILDQTGLASDWLEIEVTESMVMHDAESAIRFLQQLKLLGVRLSIDDFGTGYSSLAYLRHLPVDCVKIDRSFIKDIPNEVDDMAITAGIIGLAHCLRLEVVAEGIETADQLEFLKENRCDEIQGFFFSKPLPGAEVSSLLERKLRIPRQSDHQFQAKAATDSTAIWPPFWGRPEGAELGSR
ncbi:EAL domain-containing protein [Massilia sp. RP-1-19]|uniref:EAL domain-containing protein n=1 Tax=Massilia polaris TaxID=2728846 RepID=A0A848HU31_9BURK|nr:EAL domain-containing protein [Massilia polaris]NML62178.1 EAL domain-containing protein [Massilia polaris]